MYFSEASYRISEDLIAPPCRVFPLMFQLLQLGRNFWIPFTYRRGRNPPRTLPSSCGDTRLGGLVTERQRGQHDHKAGRDSGLALLDTNHLLNWYQLRLRCLAVTWRRQFRNNQPPESPKCRTGFENRNHTRKGSPLAWRLNVCVTRSVFCFEWVLDTSYIHTN